MKSKETHDKPILYLWSKTPGLGDDATQMTIRLRGDEKDRWLTSSRKSPPFSYNTKPVSAFKTTNFSFNLLLGICCHMQ